MVHCTVFPIVLEQRLLIDDLKTSDHFQGRASTGSGLFAFLSDDFEQIFGQIVSTTEKTLSNTNLEASRHIKREKRFSSGLRASFKNVVAYKLSIFRCFTKESIFGYTIGIIYEVPAALWVSPLTRNLEQPLHLITRRHTRR